MAPTDTQRMYLSGINSTPRRVAFYRSDDGGTTIRELPFDVPTLLSGAYVAGVDPHDEDVVYVRGNLDTSVDAGGPEATTVLLRSRNGGMTWQEIARTAGPMLGFAISDDGRTLWYGGPDDRDGLFRSINSGDTFQRIGQQEVLCLRQHAGTLYMCANYVLSFALGRSTDNGTTFSTLLSFENVQGPFTCPDTSPENNICLGRWPLIRNMFVLPDAGSDLDAGMRDSGLDATGASEMGRVGSCGCEVVGGGTRNRQGPWLGLGLLGLFAVIRKRRAPS